MGAAKTRVEACPCAAHAAIEMPARDAGSPLWLTEHGRGPLQVRACVCVCVGKAAVTADRQTSPHLLENFYRNEGKQGLK